ncbi:MAG TPA: histidine phosphatase family protein [Candidatus Baltobacteraceae bacterium]|jgi:broad specificity phosphatase PhoE|nr:histidine phosphatase family protein [Candidatus Baltobacteraceae bacterium]
MSLRLTLISNATTHAVHSACFPSDEPLDQRGEEQTQAVAGVFRSVRIAYTSPALRARQTASALKLNATVEPALRDCDYGRWAGRPLEEVQAKEPEAVAAWMAEPHSAPHGGESIITVLQRVATWLDARSEMGRMVAVTHPTIVRTAILHVLGASVESFWRIDVEPLGRTEFSHDGRRWILRSVNSALPQ